jgi:hypothetical protein
MRRGGFVAENITMARGIKPTVLFGGNRNNNKGEN